MKRGCLTEVGSQCKSESALVYRQQQAKTDALPGNDQQTTRKRSLETYEDQ